MKVTMGNLIKLILSKNKLAVIFWGMSDYKGNQCTYVIHVQKYYLAEKFEINPNSFS